MSGVTDSPFRRLVLEASGDSVGLVMSEFIHVGCLTQKTLFSLVRLAFHPSERPVAVQLYGSDPQLIADAARMVEDAGASIVDLNCGCPAPKVVRRGGGAGLLKNLPLLGQIVEAMTQAVSIPVTVKIRNGWCDETLNPFETLRVAEQSGARALSVHGRTRVQLYRGKADWDVVKELKERASIPILGSGDVMTAADARERFEATGCDGIMIGRGAITNPWIFRQIEDEWNGRPIYRPSWGERVSLLERYHEMLVDTYPDKVIPGRLKMMLSRTLKATGELADLRLTCLREKQPKDIIGHFKQFVIDRGLSEVRSLNADAVSIAA